MPSVLDVFNEDAFGVVEMTEAVNLLPYQPSRLGQLGLFQTKGITTTSAMIERRGNKLSLLPSVPRGTGGTKRPAGRRDARALLVPHIPHNDIVLADDVQDVRAFGEATTLETVAGVVADRQQNMVQNHETTEEWLRVGAIKGLILDGDGSTTLHNLRTEFDTGSETAVDFEFTDATTDIKLQAMAVRRAIEDVLGGTTFTKIRALCSNTFWDALISHAMVAAAYDRWMDGAFFRQDHRSGGDGAFEFAGIVWENYRGSIGGTSFITADTARFFPEGVNGLFMTYYAPADYVEAVNTVGRRIYSKQRRLEFDRGIEIETQSNPLPICTRPDVLINGTMS